MYAEPRHSIHSYAQFCPYARKNLRPNQAEITSDLNSRWRPSAMLDLYLSVVLVRKEILHISAEFDERLSSTMDIKSCSWFSKWRPSAILDLLLDEPNQAGMARGAHTMLTSTRRWIGDRRRHDLYRVTEAISGQVPVRSPGETVASTHPRTVPPRSARRINGLNRRDGRTERVFLRPNGRKEEQPIVTGYHSANRPHLFTPNASRSLNAKFDFTTGWFFVRLFVAH